MKQGPRLKKRAAVIVKQLKESAGGLNRDELSI